jgi:hypothetical protein
MKRFLTGIATLAIAQAVAVGNPANAAAPSASSDPVHRYVVESTSPPNSRGKAKANDAMVGVHWLRSYSTADKTRTYSLYEAPNEEAIRKAAALNKLVVIHVDEAPVDLDSESDARSGKLPAGMHRYMIERTFPAGALDGLDSTAKAQQCRVLLRPVAAMLAFVDPGLAKDADCAALLAQARSGGK